MVKMMLLGHGEVIRLRDTGEPANANDEVMVMLSSLSWG